MPWACRHTQTRQTKTCLLPYSLLPVPAAPNAGKCRFLIAWAPANKWDCLNLFLVGGQRFVVVTLPIMCSIYLAIYRPRSHQLSPIISRCPVPYPILGLPGSSDDPLPCIDNPASPLHTRTLAHALQPPWPWPLVLCPATTAEKKTAAAAHDLYLCVLVCASACLSVCVSTGDNRKPPSSHPTQP